MKLVTFTHRTGTKPGLLVERGEQVVDLSGEVRDMVELIEQGERLAAEHDRFLQPRMPRFDVADVRLIAPLPRPPRNIFCVGKNYRDHASEFAKSGFDSSAGKGGAVPELPIVFSKPPSSVIGPGAPVDASLDPLHSVDYEAELAVVIGRRGRVGPQDDPWSFVFGYTLVNDITSRELQKQHRQWLLGKGIDGFCPMGPSIVTKDSIPNIRDAWITCHVNGELRQRASIADLIFDIPTLVATIGRSITLEPGDVIATGTPAGVGIGFVPPRYLRRGDVVRIELAEIGVLENPIV
jgi:2-keto-4-pentenoate hydratase/2-oxohepta-3-ene-1,7-dioic acid hydratase in catechol pathway